MRKSREWQLTNSQAAVEVIPSSRTRGAIKTVSEQSDTVFYEDSIVFETRNYINIVFNSI